MGLALLDCPNGVAGDMLAAVHWPAHSVVEAVPASDLTCLPLACEQRASGGCAFSLTLEL